MTWMNAACKAAAIKLPDEALGVRWWGMSSHSGHTVLVNAGACLDAPRLV